MTSPETQEVRERIVSSWSSMDEATTVPHHSGGVVLRVGLAEVGHLHPDGALHLFFPRPLRDELVRSGEVEAHRDMTDSGWVSFRVCSASDVPRALELLKQARDAGRSAGLEPDAQGTTPSAGGAPVTEQAIDESSKESFPASDPPSVSHET